MKTIPTLLRSLRAPCFVKRHPSASRLSRSFGRLLLLGVLAAVTGWFEIRAATPVPPSFRAPTYYPTGSRTAAVAAGDLNHDGYPDLVVGERGSARLYVLLSRGDGTFQTNAPYPTFSGPFRLAIADLNHDGHLDVVLGYYPDPGTTSAATVWLGNGDGTLGVRHDLNPGPNLSSVVVADFNRDGHPDLAFTPYGAGGAASVIAILDGVGDGTFLPPRQIAGGCCGAGSLLAADFNEDGHLDLLVGNNSEERLNLVLGNGDGSFKPRIKLNVPAGEVWGLAAGDLNHDGHLDIVSANVWAQRVVVFPGVGDGTFPIAELIRIDGVPYLIQVADCNGDGHLDLVVGLNQGQAVAVLTGFGNATFNPPVRFAVAGYPETMTVADFNADGSPDVAVACSSGQGVAVLINQCEQCIPPRISHQPTHVVLKEGASGVLDVEVKGYPEPAVQWQFNGQPITGATTSTLALATVTRAVEGVYTVVASNRLSQVTSKPIVVTVSNVDPVPLVLLKWDGANAGPVALEVATLLTPSMTWSVLTNYPASASPQTHLEAILPVSSRFYRLNAAQALRFSTAGHVNSWSITHPAGSRVLVEYSTSQVGWTNWLALTTLTLPSSPYPFVDEASLTEPSRVYRTSVVP